MRRRCHARQPSAPTREQPRPSPPKRFRFSAVQAGKRHALLRSCILAYATPHKPEQAAPRHSHAYPTKHPAPTCATKETSPRNTRMNRTPQARTSTTTRNPPAHAPTPTATGPPPTPTRPRHSPIDSASPATRRAAESRSATPTARSASAAARFPKASLPLASANRTSATPSHRDTGDAEQATDCQCSWNSTAQHVEKGVRVRVIATSSVQASAPHRQAKG